MRCLLGIPCVLSIAIACSVVRLEFMWSHESTPHHNKPIPDFAQENAGTRPVARQ